MSEVFSAALRLLEEYVGSVIPFGEFEVLVDYFAILGVSKFSCVTSGLLEENDISGYF